MEVQFAAMISSPAVAVRVDLARIRANALDVRRRAEVPLLAVVKADAYGLGAAAVIPILTDLVDGFCFFSLREAVEIDFGAIATRPAITLGPPTAADASTYARHRIRPAVSSVAQASEFRAFDPILAIDTGQQRFACPPADIAAALAAGGCTEAMTHAVTLAQAHRFRDLAAGRSLRLHAAGTSLLDQPGCRFDAVRPGMALYRGALRVSTRLVEVRDSAGPAGYSGFQTGRHGVILCGYATGLRAGPCLVNGRPSRILEVGMQSAFVDCAPADRVGDEVVLVGDSLGAHAVAADWGASMYACFVQLAGLGAKTYAGPDVARPG